MSHVHFPDKQLIPLHGGHLTHLPTFLPHEEAEHLFGELMRSAPWEKHFFPRLVAWYGDFDYEYAGVRHPAAPWTTTLAHLRNQLEQIVFGESRGQYQGVLLNLYRDGRDSVGFHSDNEPMLRRGAPIASLSLGATRSFLLQPHRRSPVASSASAQRLSLVHGSLLIMGGSLQDHWVHSIPKELDVRSPRINLTFRCYNVPKR